MEIGVTKAAGDRNVKSFKFFQSPGEHHISSVQITGTATFRELADQIKLVADVFNSGGPVVLEGGGAAQLIRVKVSTIEASNSSAGGRSDSCRARRAQIELINTNFKLLQHIHHEVLFNRLVVLYEKVSAIRRSGTTEEISARAPFIFSLPELDDSYK